MGPDSFRVISEYPEYEVNAGGMIRNRHSHIILMWKPSSTTGKACVELKDPENSRRRVMVSVMHLVISTWGDKDIAESSKRFIENWRVTRAYGETEIR